MNSVDNGDMWQFKEVQWCDHIKVDPQNCRGYAILQDLNMGYDLTIGYGRVRITCQSCTPGLLAKLFNASVSLNPLQGI